MNALGALSTLVSFLQDEFILEKKNSMSESMDGYKLRNSSDFYQNFRAQGFLICPSGNVSLSLL